MRGKLKGLFFILRLHYLLPGYLLKFIGYLSDLSIFIHKNKCLNYSDFYSFKFDYSKRESLYRYVINKEDLNSKIDYLEFGVSKGNSFNWWTNANKDRESRFYGFDTFNGLPEKWGYFKKGDMSNDNKPPIIHDNRVEYFQGLFQETLLPFLANYENLNPKVIHMDADLYSATLYVLTLIYPYLKPGDVIFFDEFNVPMHEFKAFSEWTSSFYIEYEILGAVNNFYQLAMKIK